MQICLLSSIINNQGDLRDLSDSLISAHAKLYSALQLSM